MPERFDAIVIGTGQAAPALCARLDKEGLRTALIERKLLGGTCVNVGCIPTKTLIASARAAHIARRGAEYGFSAGNVQVDMRAGWRGRVPKGQAIEVFLDVFNLTNRANFDNPSGDERVAATFLVLTNLRGGGGFPRQAQLGVRYMF